MQFRLTYRGRLKSGNSRDIVHIHEIRKKFHSQLKMLWQQPPLESRRSDLLKHGGPDVAPGVLEKVGEITFAPLITAKLHLHAELDILFLRPAPPGALFKHGGDLDNRIKTLFDCLRKPESPNELPSGILPEEGEEPFFCLLQDDKLVSAFSVVSDRLLESDADEQDAEIIIKVHTRAITGTFSNISLSI